LKEGAKMFWLTLSIALILAAAIGAVLLRHPGVVLYDWIVTRQAATRARRCAMARARPVMLQTRPVSSAAQAQPRPAEHAEPAALAG